MALFFSDFILCSHMLVYLSFNTGYLVRLEEHSQSSPLLPAAALLSGTGLLIVLPEIWLTASVRATGHLQAMWEAHADWHVSWILHYAFKP